MVSGDVPGGARAVARCDELGVVPYSDLPDRLFRAYLTPAHIAAIERVGAWMRQAGMATRIDPAGNLIGRYEGTGADAPAIVIGSHIDSVRDAGRYDGPLGIMLGIECVDGLHRAGRRLPHAVEVVAFGDEEGSRFPAPMLTSRAFAGTLSPGMLAIADGDGILLDRALAECGLDIGRVADAARPPAAIRAYVEVHIEQGPALEAQDLPVATVTGIAAQARYAIAVAGEAGHAGTTAMTLRHDALAAAAEMILAVERIAAAGTPDLVGTIGRIEVAPGAPNVVPGDVAMTIDVRAGRAAVRDDAAGAMLAAIRAIAAARGVAVTIEDVHALDASPCDPALVDLMDRAITECGGRVHRLVSGAGHDAMVLAAFCPTAMLFVRSPGGISHHPAEAVLPADVDMALRVLARFVELLGEKRG